MAPTSSSASPDWERRLHALLPVFGHRNWIVIADSAYPAQSKPGIETLYAGGDQIDAVRKVSQAIAEQKHIRANIYLDEELAFVSDAESRGADEYREQIKGLLGASATRLPHEQIIARLDQSAQVFRILIVKTDLTIPYTSVFFELDCGYWSAESEQRLRKLIAAEKSKR
jgi:L-fucose mutarotase/ribose pyranase (RbsD/FucU family)